MGDARSITRQRGALAGAAVLALIATLATADRAPAQGIDRESFKTTIQLASGDVRNPSVSQDDRFARVIAYEDGDQIRAVFRAGSFSNSGEAWQPGETRTIARGSSPDVGGMPGAEPRCIAFVSRASNLVRGDTNGRSDAFMYDLRTKRIRRVSVSSTGRQANGDTTDVAVSGDCRRVVFTSTATNLALTGLRGLSQRKRRARSFAVTSAPSRRRNIYMRILDHRFGADRFLDGLTFLVSAHDRRPAGGDSFDPDIALLRGDLVAFATNGALTRSDRNRATDVYVRTLERRRVRVGGRTTGTIGLGTQLVSVTSGGAAGNGPSRRPSMDGIGRYVFFDTNATDVLPDDGNGHTDAVRATRVGGGISMLPVSEVSGSLGNGPSVGPIASGGGTNALFLTDASNFLVPGGPQKNFGFNPTGPGDNNGVRDAGLWTVNRRITLIESRGSGGELLNEPTTAIDWSHRTNYVAFVSGGRLLLRYLGPQSIGN